MPPLSEGRALARDARRRATRRAVRREDAPSWEPGQAGRNEDASDDEAGESSDGADGHPLDDLLEPGVDRPTSRRSGLIAGLRGAVDNGRQRLLEDDQAPAPAQAGGGNGRPPRAHLPKRIGSRRPRRPRRGRVKKLRLAVILLGLATLAVVSIVFGMMMAVAQDLPALEDKEQYAAAQNTEVFDVRGRKMGTLLSNSRRILVESEDISPNVKQAVVAVEDERFYEHRGVDYVGIGRAFVQDVIPGGGTQGASTITMQFVKNALEAQGSRTVFQKLREAALAYHLERQWDKDKILTQYLNTIYFGEGAYGIEAAARTYFGSKHPGCGVEGGDTCASELDAHEAAMLAGIITSPSAYSPRANPQAATTRRNLVLTKMHEQGVLDDLSYEEAIAKSVPAPSDIGRPEEDSLAPYFTSWLRQQVVDLYGAGRAFGGGLDVHTTLDLDMQEVAQNVAYDTLAGIAPTASIVVIDNSTGGVRAMVGGNDFEKAPFNLATNGHRQPGSAFKPFTLVTALENGYSSGDVFASQKKYFNVPGTKGKEKFEVNNYDDTYYGSSTLRDATIHSDNSIYAELGMEVGTKRIAATAHEMGIGTDFSTNPAMILGGIDPGVSPLEMTYAFSTLAHDGLRLGGSLDTIPGNNNLYELGPVAMSKIELPNGDVLAKNEPKQMRAVSDSVAAEIKGILEDNVQVGTGVLAQWDGTAWGKTGTTENNGDAWFCGGSNHFTACVWVGHAQTNTPMETEYNGGPVDGGTFPALIWSRLIEACEEIWREQEAEKNESEDDDSESSSSSSSTEPSYSSPSEDSGGGSDSSSGGSGSGGGGGPNAPSAPAPAPAPAPSGGGEPSGAGGAGGVGL